MITLRNILDPEKRPGHYQAILETTRTALTLGWYHVGAMRVAASTGHLDVCWGEFSASEFPKFYHKGLIPLGKRFIPLGDRF